MSDTIPDGLSQSPDVMSGSICVKGHRFPVSQLLTDLAGNRTVHFIADDFSIPRERFEAAVLGAASAFSRGGLIESQASIITTLKADCERWSAMYAIAADDVAALMDIRDKQADELTAHINASMDHRVQLAAKLGLVNCDSPVLLAAVQKQADELVAAKFENERLKKLIACPECHRVTQLEEELAKLMQIGNVRTVCQQRETIKELKSRMAEMEGRNERLRTALTAAHATISRIDYLLGEPNEMGHSQYDVDCDDERVVGCVATLKAKLAEVEAAISDVNEMYAILANRGFSSFNSAIDRADAAEKRVKALGAELGRSLDALRLCKLYGSQGDIDDGREGATSVSSYVDKAIDAAEAALATTPPAAGELTKLKAWLAEPISASHPLVDLLFRKTQPKLTQEQAESAAALVVGELNS